MGQPGTSLLTAVTYDLVRDMARHYEDNSVNKESETLPCRRPVRTCQQLLELMLAPPPAFLLPNPNLPSKLSGPEWLPYCEIHMQMRLAALFAQKR